MAVRVRSTRGNATCGGVRLRGRRRRRRSERGGVVTRGFFGGGDDKTENEIKEEKQVVLPPEGEDFWEGEGVGLVVTIGGGLVGVGAIALVLTLAQPVLKAMTDSFPSAPTTMAPTLDTNGNPSYVLDLGDEDDGDIDDEDADEDEDEQSPTSSGTSVTSLFSLFDRNTSSGNDSTEETELLEEEEAREALDAESPSSTATVEGEEGEEQTEAADSLSASASEEEEVLRDTKILLEPSEPLDAITPEKANDRQMRSEFFSLPG